MEQGRKGWGGLALVVAGTVMVFLMNSVVFSQEAASQDNFTDGSTFVGVEKCKGCHAKEYNDFSGRKFDRVWKILNMRGEQNNPQCLKCHTTGYGKAGGFVSGEKTPGMTSKQCEACHGPGSKHVANPGDSTAMSNMRIGNKSKNICIECHLCMSTHSTVEY
jgi:NAD-dependent SIR2 family protein deacetylase